MWFDPETLNINFANCLLLAKSTNSRNDMLPLEIEQISSIIKTQTSCGWKGIICKQSRNALLLGRFLSGVNVQVHMSTWLSN